MEIIESQKKIIDSQKETIGSQNKEIHELKEKIDRVEKELRRYKNENNPSSANKHLKAIRRDSVRKEVKEVRHSGTKALQEIRNLMKSTMWTRTNVLTATAMTSKMWMC
ncbi:hypothetical protein M1590_04030 [Candidatus Marsarchaeota archaeon]|nr:hypothetical protein [Candidatus Marsarchaeota archaeon]